MMFLSKLFKDSFDPERLALSLLAVSLSNQSKGVEGYKQPRDNQKVVDARGKSKNPTMPIIARTLMIIQIIWNRFFWRFV